MILLALLAATRMGDLGIYPELSRYKDLPAPVRVFMDRRMGCNHWTGEEPYDRDRAREIARAVRKLGCDRLDADETRLRRRYGQIPLVAEALDDVRERLW